METQLKEVVKDTKKGVLTDGDVTRIGSYIAAILKKERKEQREMLAWALLILLLAAVSFVVGVVSAARSFPTGVLH